MLHGVQLDAFDTVVKDPLGHAVQERSAVAEPSAPTALPGTQLVQLTQAVAALASWSHEPGAHASFGVAAPAQ